MKTTNEEPKLNTIIKLWDLSGQLIYVQHNSYRLYVN